MIEGIVLLFTVLLAILVIPYIKDFVSSRRKETVSYKIFPNQPEPPKRGDAWLDTSTGDIWFY